MQQVMGLCCVKRHHVSCRDILVYTATYTAAVLDWRRSDDMLFFAAYALLFIFFATRIICGQDFVFRVLS